MRITGRLRQAQLCTIPEFNWKPQVYSFKPFRAMKYLYSFKSFSTMLPNKGSDTIFPNAVDECNTDL